MAGWPGSWPPRRPGVVLEFACSYKEKECRTFEKIFPKPSLDPLPPGQRLLHGVRCLFLDSEIARLDCVHPVVRSKELNLPSRYAISNQPSRGVYKMNRVFEPTVAV